MKERDKIDRKQHKLKVKQRHQESRWKEKESRREQQAVKEGVCIVVSFSTILTLQLKGGRDSCVLLPAIKNLWD